MSDVNREALVDRIIASLNENAGRIACLDHHQAKALLSLLHADAAKVQALEKELRLLRGDFANEFKRAEKAEADVTRLTAMIRAFVESVAAGGAECPDCMRYRGPHLDTCTFGALLAELEAQ